MDLKAQAAQAAIAYLQSDMVIGLGSGSTVNIFLEILGQKLQEGAFQNIIGVPTSEATAQKAKTLGIPLAALDQHTSLDVAIDGADEVDPQRNLIKGLGKALLREKLVEIHAQKLVIIVDESKYVEKLGTNVPLPVEIIPFGSGATIKWMNSLHCRAELWLDDAGNPFVTDNGNYLVRCWFENSIPNAIHLARALDGRPGVVEHGLFLDMADTVLIATPQGIKTLQA